MITDRKESADSNLWSFIFSIVFGVLMFGLGYYLFSMGVDFREGLGPFEFVVISLATFRLTRLLVYDSIALWIRDIFLDRKRVGEGHVFIVKREIPTKGFRRKMAELFECPWCIGTWVVLGVLFLFYVHPIGWWIILGVAIAGLSTFIQLLANLIGWNAEASKKSVSSLEMEQEGI